MSRKAQQFRKHFGALPAAGPSSCLRTRQAPATCPSCGAAGVVVRHMLLRAGGPSHCGACCPCCGPRLTEAA